MPSRRSLLATTLGFASLRVAGVARAAEPLAKWQAGVHYRKLENPQTPTTLGKVEVNEVFWYGCPHCFALEPVLEGWRPPAFVEFVRTPVMWGPLHRQHAKLYYTLQELRRPDLHPLVFQAIHNEGALLADRDHTRARALQFAFLNQHDVTAEQFDAAFDSDAVNSQLENAESVTRAYKVANVPTFFVAGKYSATAGDAGGPAQLLALLTNLAESERR